MSLSEKITNVVFADAITMLVLNLVEALEAEGPEAAKKTICERILEAVKRRIDDNDLWLDFAVVPDNKNYTNDDMWNQAADAYVVAYEHGFIDAINAIVSTI